MKTDAYPIEYGPEANKVIFGQMTDHTIQPENGQLESLKEKESDS